MHVHASDPQICDRLRPFAWCSWPIGYSINLSQLLVVITGLRYFFLDLIKIQESRIDSDNETISLIKNISLKLKPRYSKNSNNIEKIEYINGKITV